MTSAARRRYQAENIRRRAKEPPSSPQRCSVMGCARPTQRASGKGLSERYCRNHQEHYRRHGSYWRRSYLVRELEPYRKAAKAWLKANRDDPHVGEAIRALDSLLAVSGRSESAFHLRGKPPEERARIALARLHAAGKPGKQLLEIVLTVKAATSALGPRGNPEFQHVQIAKMAHRLSSGTILRNHEGRPYSEIHGGKRSLFERYPRAEGIFMRLMGKRIRERADLAADREAIEEVLCLAQTGRAP